MENTKTCPFCGSEIDIEAKRCKVCKRWLDELPQKPRKFLDTLLLAWFLGVYGAHRFFTGHYVIGLIQLFTMGGCGIWWLIDLFSICLGNFRDSNDAPLENYDKRIGIGALILYFAIGFFVALLILIMFLIIVFAADIAVRMK